MQWVSSSRNRVNLTISSSNRTRQHSDNTAQSSTVGAQSSADDLKLQRIALSETPTRCAALMSATRRKTSR